MGHMATEITAIDKIDREILGILQTDGRISWQMLGDRVHLSPNAVAERVRRLTKAGVIKGFRVDINQAALGRTLEAVIDARMAHTQGFDDALMKRDDVLWAAHVTGESDVTLAVACDGTAGLDAFLRWLQREGGLMAAHNITILGDDLFSHQPHCEKIKAQNMHFILVCKEDSHTTLYEWLADFERENQVQNVTRTRWDGKHKIVDQYRLMNHLPQGKRI